MFDRDLAILAAKETIVAESDAVRSQLDNIDQEYIDAIKCLFECVGKVVISGMGKSGIIGKKFAASLASTGTPSFYLHPGEAFHGDLGMITSQDVVVLLSNSGETDEVLKILPHLKHIGCKCVAISSNKGSTLGKNSDFHIVSKVIREACPLNLAPTSSTTAVLAVTDSVVVVLMRLRELKPEKFAQFHPGGSLGKRLLTKVKDLMVYEHLPIVRPDASLKDVISVISMGGCGVAVVFDTEIKGVITDGDIRRSMETYESSFFTLKAIDVCSNAPIMIGQNFSIVEAESLFRSAKVNTLLVECRGRLTGILKIKDVLN